MSAHCNIHSTPTIQSLKLSNSFEFPHPTFKPTTQLTSTHHGRHHGTSHGKAFHIDALVVTNKDPQLSKAEEEGSDEVEVRREDQDKINKFSRLHQRELALQEELTGKSVSLTPISP